MQRVLVVDDNVALAEMLQLVLKSAGFDSHWCNSGDRAMAAFLRYGPDLVLLDLMLPGRDGVNVCRDIRAVSGVPIVMLTAKSDTRDVVEGLEAGADDYVTKPVKVKELLARIRTRLRRHDQGPQPQELVLADLVINAAEHTVRRGPTLIPLTPLEFDLLLVLAQRPRQALSRELLLQQVWGYRTIADTKLVNVHIQRLRSKIERDPEHPEIIVTVRGVGYRAGGVGDGT